MSNTGFTIEALIATIRDLAAESPTNEYRKRTQDPWALYSVGGDIFGQAFTLLGIDPAQYDRKPDSTQPYSIDQILEQFGYPEWDDRVCWCVNMQQMHDRGYAWRQCIEESDAEYPLD